MLPRTLEPEVMDTPDEARDYDAMDHAGVNAAFVDDLLARTEGLVPPGEMLSVLDVGTGTALIPIELVGRGRPVRVTAIDLAEQMLALGRENVARVGFEPWIALERVDAKSLPYGDGTFDVVMSNSIVHHVAAPGPLLREMLRVLRPGGLLFVRDLFRPADEATVERLVETYAGGENADQRQLFRQSLHAALTVDEMRALLGDLGLDPACCTATSDRHWTIALRRDR